MRAYLWLATEGTHSERGGSRGEKVEGYSERGEGKEEASAETRQGQGESLSRV